jgi:hypothetical protein
MFNIKSSRHVQNTNSYTKYDSLITVIMKMSYAILLNEDCEVCVEVSEVPSSSNLRQKTVLRKEVFTGKAIGLQNPRDIYLGNNSKVTEFVFHNSPFLHHRLIRWYS